MRLNGYKKKYVFLFQIIEYVCLPTSTCSLGERTSFVGILNSNELDEFKRNSIRKNLLKRDLSFYNRW